MTIAPVFPPLMTGMAAGPANPVPIAIAQAERGTDAGLLVWSLTDERLRAALVLAPETKLEQSMAALVACAVGMQNALGALAPPETAVHIDWTGELRLNGAHVGGLRAIGREKDLDRVPDWMVVALDLTLCLPDKLEPGQTPNWTALDQEGCGEIEPIALLEAWARHSLLWLSDLEEAQGRASLYREWKGLVWNLGQTISVPLQGETLTGTFLGVDENFGMILKTTTGTRLLPLTVLLERD
ncbi:DUF4444 domain-containing protein [Thioclava sp. FR2]|uniref:biotin/lipoate--protein ligase family protein n=1 Tax=Thioclava sp. FR2 TaxID=3445780 RepID=UPI003EBDB43A